MFDYVRERFIRNQKIVFTVLPLISAALIFVNDSILRSFLVGLSLLFLYLFANGEIFGRAFYGDENRFFRFVFGSFTFIALLSLTGFFAALVTRRQIWYLLGLVFAAFLSSVVNLLWVKYDRAAAESSRGLRGFFKVSRFSVLYIMYIVLLVASFLMLFNERSGWVLAQPSLWAVLPSIFVQLYFFATTILVGIAILPGRLSVKLILVAFHSMFTLSFVPIIVYPGMISLEGWYDLGRARVVSNVVDAFYASTSLGALSFVRALNSSLKGASIQSLVVTFSNSLNIDMYWGDVVLIPILWGFFVPLTSYKLTERMGGSKRASMIAALITIPNYYFLAWGKLSISDSLGNLFFFLWVYLLLRYLGSSKTRMLLPMLVILATIAATHFLPLLMSISFAVTAFALKRYEPLRSKFSYRAQLLLLEAFVISVLLLPISVIVRGIILPALGEPAFSINKLLNASVWGLVLGVSEKSPVQQGLLYYLLLPLLGLAGAIYALQRKNRFSRILVYFLFLSFGISVLNNRILEYAVVEGLFGAGRLNFFRDVAILPFAALVIELIVEFLHGNTAKAITVPNWKKIAAGTLICIGFSSWVMMMVYDNYAFYARGLIGTSLEVEAIRYIDQNTDSRYVVFAPRYTGPIAWGFLGYPFPPGKLYVGTSTVPTVNNMYLRMKEVEADVGYFMAPSFRLPSAIFDKIIRAASRVFGLFKVLTGDVGDIYIFEYKIPPLPESPDIVAFYWDTPPTYYIQNDLMRIIINPATKSLSVEDFWGIIFESIELNGTTVGGNAAGNLTSLEYFDNVNSEWFEWTPAAEIPLVNQFQFRLIFETDSLVGLVERGKGAVQLRWESGRVSTLNLGTGDFQRLYIPGLVGGPDSFDVMSRQFGFLYTESLTDGVALHPAYNSSVSTTSLTYSQIREDCGFNLTKAAVSYDLYVHNNASVDQWAYIETWLPNEVYTGTWPPFWFSLDEGKTWIYAPYDVDVESSVPVKTIEGAEVNWIFSVPRFRRETPYEFKSYYSPLAQGGVPKLPGNYTDSGGAQNRIIFGLYLPAGDQALLRLGAAAYKPRPLELSYVFRDSDNVAYGLRNMEEGLIKLYGFGVSQYVGGIALNSLPISLVVTQNEQNEIHAIQIAVPSNTTFSLLSEMGVDTTIDGNADGVPDRI